MRRRSAAEQAETPPPLRAWQRPELRELGLRVQRPASLRRQLQRLQRLRSRQPEEAEAARLESSAPGGQGDVSVHGNLLVMSVEQTRGRIDCGTQGVEPAVSAERFRGVRIFDITDVKKPRQVAAVQTCRGSHTHTLVATPNDKANLYVYGSGTGTVRAGEELAGCSAARSEGRSEHRALQHRRHPDSDRHPREGAHRRAGRGSSPTRRAARSRGCGPAAITAPGTQKTSETNQCHDITVFPAVGLAAGACSGNGILLDISDPVKPVRLDHVMDKNFAYWHSATFNNDGTEGALHRRVGRRHPPALPRDGSPELGRRRHLRHRRSQAEVRRLLQAAGAADRAGELCRAQRLADSRCRAATSWCRRGIRAASRCSTSPIRPSRSRSRFSIAVRSTPPTSLPAGYWSRTGTTATSTGPRSPAASTSSG